jgi:hypothetical protein
MATWRAYLLVQKTPGATTAMDPSPAQDTGDHERKQNEIADERRDDTDFGAQDISKHTTAIISQVPARCD